MGCRRGKLAASTDPEYESRIQAALADVANGTHKNITRAAKAYKVKSMWFCCGFESLHLNAKLILQVARQTLKDRSSGLHMSVKDYSTSRQILNPNPYFTQQYPP